MKTCLLCTWPAEDAHETCQACGEATWSEAVADAPKSDETKDEPKPAKKAKR